jgi:hypothetical protein
MWTLEVTGGNAALSVVVHADQCRPVGSRWLELRQLYDMVTVKPNQYTTFKPLPHAFLPDDVFVPFRTSWRRHYPTAEGPLSILRLHKPYAECHFHP